MKLIILISKETTRMGFEPTTSAVTGRRSNQLSHRAKRYIPSKLHTEFLLLLSFILQEYLSRTNFSTLRIFGSSISLSSMERPSCLALRSSPHPISNSQLHALLHFHLCPIYLVVFKGVYFFSNGTSHLEGGFTLRCLQRLSLPDLATRP